MRCGGGSHVAVDVAARDVHKDEADELAVFVADRGRAGLVADVREHGDGDLAGGDLRSAAAGDGSESGVIGTARARA